MKFSTTILVGGQPVILNVPKHTKAYQKANSIFVPLGPGHSEANFVMTRGAVNALDINTPQEIVWSQIAENMGGGAFADGVKELTFNGFYFNKATRLLQGGPDDDSALYLVNLVDSRYLININSGTGPRRVNLRSYANSTDYLTGTTTLGTWNSLLEDLWQRLSDDLLEVLGTNVLGDWPGLPATFAFDHVPENYNVSGVNCWQAICAILDHWDCAVVHNPLSEDEPYWIVQLGSDQVLADNDARLKWDGNPIMSGITSAAKLYFYFWIHRKAFGQERHTELGNNWAYNGTHVVIASTTNIEGAIGSKPIHTDLPIVLDENGIITNLSAAQTRATRLTQSYIMKESTAPIHKVFSGLLDDYVLGGRLRGILWRNWDDGQGTQTEIMGGPDFVSLDSNGGGLLTLDRNLVTPTNEFISTPDLSRHSYPNYPHIVNIVQCTSSSGNFVYGDASNPNAQGFHYGLVRRWVNNSMTRLERCWIRFIDDHDVDNGQVQAVLGQFYGPAMLSGISTAGGITYPVYLVSTNCCPSSGSGGHSGSQDGGSLSGPPDDNIDQSCCIDKRGSWPANFPSTLTMVISGSCCTSMNRTVTLTKRSTFSNPTYTSTTNTITGCANINLNLSVTLSCTDGEWSVGFALTGGVRSPTNPCPIKSGILSASTTLTNCTPLTFTGSGVTQVGKLASGSFGCTDYFCAGTFSFTITE